MNKLLLVIFVVHILFFNVGAQQSSNLVLEKQFESTDLYFQRYFLNTFGMYNLEKVAPAFFEDRFSRLKLNPAPLLNDSLHKTEVYLDFRSNREYEFPQQFVRPLDPFRERIALANPSYDLRWYRITRSEPEPVVSFGLQHWLTKRFQLTTTYQLIYKNEPFYQQPVYFYQPNLYYDNFDNRMLPSGVDAPIYYFEHQNDQVLTRAHLFAMYFGFKLSPHLALGMGGNFVQHKRNFDHTIISQQNNQNDQSTLLDLYQRNFKYHHQDWFAGLKWRLNRKWQMGIQAGRLGGRATQTHLRQDTTYYQYSNGFYHFNSQQNTNLTHDGSRNYLTATFQFSPNSSNRLLGFVNVARLNYNIDDRALFTNNSLSEYHYQTNAFQYTQTQSLSTLYESRKGKGELKETLIEGMATVIARQNTRSRIHIGLYYSYLTGEKNITEPVVYNSQSQTQTQTTDQNDIRSLSIRKMSEDKILYWNYNYTKQTIQLPVYWWHRLGDQLAIFVIINKYWTAWEVKEKTEAYYLKQETVIDDKTEIKENFVMRYDVNPSKNYTDDETDLALGFELPIFKNVTIRYLLNPDLVPDMHISQWWLSLMARF